MRNEDARFETQLRDGVHVVKILDARLLDEMTISEIGRRLAALVAGADAPKIVLDFSNVTHMSSSALGVLITIHKRIGEKEGELRFACIRPSIYEVFVITRLKEIFSIHSTVEDALAGLG